MMLLFIGYLHLGGYAPASITSYVCAIGYAHKIKSVPDPTSSFIVQRVLAAANKLNPTTDNRLPITVDILKNIISSTDTVVSNSYNRSLLKAMFLVSFFGLLRVGEITSDTAAQAVITLGQLTFHTQHAIINISRFKHNKSGQPFQVVLNRQAEGILCPVQALQVYCSLRGTNTGPLFCFPGLRPIPRSFYTTKLRNLLGFCGLSHTLYKSHSFRIGAASFYAALGFSDEQIRMLGRWKSNAFRKYIRCQRILNALPE